MFLALASDINAGCSNWLDPHALHPPTQLSDHCLGGRKLQQDKSPQVLTQARLKELLHYDPETGIFTRRVGCGGGRAGTADQVDHINGIRDDNRWCNLRPATGQENTHNQCKPQRNNVSGFIGVRKATDRPCFRADIRLNNRSLYLGTYATPELAHAAYLKAKDELHPTHRRLRASA